MPSTLLMEGKSKFGLNKDGIGSGATEFTRKKKNRVYTAHKTAF